MLTAVLVPYVLLRNTKNELRSQVASGKEWAQEFATGFYNAAKADMASELPRIAEAFGANIMKSVKFSDLGKLSGQSRQMKAMERDLTAMAIDSKYPGMGETAAKFLEKYPMVKSFLGQVIQPGGNGQPFSSQEGI